jgi:hypothetical protein
MVRRDAWTYGLIGLDVAALFMWLLITDLDAFAPFAFGLWWVLPPAVLALLGCLGFWMMARAEWSQRRERPLVHLKWASALVLVPLVYYAGMAFLLAMFSGF